MRRAIANVLRKSNFIYSTENQDRSRKRETSIVPCQTLEFMFHCACDEVSRDRPAAGGGGAGGVGHGAAHQKLTLDKVVCDVLLRQGHSFIYITRYGQTSGEISPCRDGPLRRAVKLSLMVSRHSTKGKQSDHL